MKLLDPLTVHHIGLAARDVLHVTSVHENNLEPSRFEDCSGPQNLDSRLS